MEFILGGLGFNLGFLFCLIIYVLSIFNKKIEYNIVVKMVVVVTYFPLFFLSLYYGGIVATNAVNKLEGALHGILHWDLHYYAALSYIYVVIPTVLFCFVNNFSILRNTPFRKLAS
ncbi:hypothetical protein [Zooshikella sp. RANM57]|uniref:hypothetical protein n=1 Tax=Zooshikella sp. RANM57 TaxID=3425863 RepID=UPI003D6E2A1B